MPAERLGPLFPAMRPQIPFDRFAVIAALDPSVVVELPQFAELRVKFFCVNSGFRLRQTERRIGGRKRQDFDGKRRPPGPPAGCGPGYIEPSGGSLAAPL